MVEFRNRPPIGAGMGLPFTWLLANNTLTTHTTATASGTNFANPSVKSATEFTLGSQTFSKTLINTEPPRLNLGTGNLLFGQQMMGVGELFTPDPLYLVNGVASSVITYSGHGRYTRFTDSNTASPSPGNYTWHAHASGTRLTVGDVPVGETRVAIGSAASDDDGRIVSACVYSAADIASGGYGRQWGDAHDTQYLVNVGCSHISTANADVLGYTWPSTGGRLAGGAGLAWTVNLAPQYHFIDSSQLNPSNDRTAAQTAGAGLSAETVMHLAHRELEAASTGTIGVHPLGSPAHGTVVVADSCGLVGYEGVMVATAHYTPSKQQDLTVPVSTQSDGFCAINILVHSGETSRRTATTANTFTASGLPVRGVAERLKTDCGMLKGSTRTTYFSNATTHYTKLVEGTLADNYRIATDLTGASVDIKTNCKRIVGDACDITGAWDGTANLNLTFAAEKVPTRVRVVPSLIGYDKTTHAPVVDYHIVVSLADRPNPVERDSTNDYSTRNNPQFDVNYTDMNMDGQPCTIWHAIFRVEPTTAATAQSVGNMVSDWGLKQATPFRPIANREWVRVPELCGAVEAGGMYQRGGLSHIWDADAFGGDLYVGADLFDCNHISGSTGNDKDGHATFGFWGHGQVWPGTAAPQVPPGRELVIFKYSANTDPYHPGQTPSAQWPLRKWLDTQSADLVDTEAVALNASIHHANHAATLTDWKGWEIHDWVFPQIELLSYLGVEDKTQPRTRHPTLHCASLRFTEEGKMVMAAMHQDIITSSAQTPNMDIGWPFNPDVMFDGLPPGYYKGTDGEVHPVNATLVNPETEEFVALIGASVPGFTEPEATNAEPTQYSGQDTVFGYIPPWNMLKPGKARSMVLLWSENGLTDGKPTKGLNKFCVKHERVGGVNQATQNWTHEDNWWTGSRIAYWYPESGQRAIPIVYGAFPALRLSNINLPRVLPRLDSNGDMKHGLPTIQPLLDLHAGVGVFAEDTPSNPYFSGMAGEDPLPNLYNFTVRHRFFPTLIGFADFGPGASPWQQWGWSGWSFPTAMYDPIPHPPADFFTDSTTRAPWANFGEAAPSSPEKRMVGPVGAISHFGPLHYGMSQQQHPFATDRIWKHVNGGVGYDVPIHSLKPGDVSVRARSGARGSLDLELETPFHITDTLHLQGQASYLTNEGTAFDKGSAPTPGGSRPNLGQYLMSTNLWENPLTGVIYQQSIEGVQASGTLIGDQLARYWKDHPTEHFHAGAMPIGYANDVDLNFLEEQRYPIPLTTSVKETNDLDALAQSEQLQASTEVFVPQRIAPVWDSGGIISARSTGTFGAVWSNRHRAGKPTYTANEFVTFNAPDSSGHGMRVIQTIDGTIHNFVVEQHPDGTTGDCIKHYTKPLHSDLFWNRSSLNYHTGSYCDIITVPNASKYESVAVAADSNGNLHIIVQSELSTDLRQLHHITTDAVIERINPEPIYKWDWSAGTTTEISTADVRHPTLVIDAQDIAHFAFVQSVDLGSGNTGSKLIYGRNDLRIGQSWTYTGLTGTFQEVALTTGAVNSLAAPQRTPIVFCPKLHLLKDGSPVVVYGGADPDATGRDGRAVYANIGVARASATGWDFTPSNTCMVLGLEPHINFTIANASHDGVKAWDSVVDNNDKLHIVAIHDNTDAADKQSAIEIAVLETDTSAFSQYSQTNGCGRHIMLYHHTTASGRQFDIGFGDITLGIDHENSIHAVVEAFQFLMTDTDSGVNGDMFRKVDGEGAAYPLNFPGTPSADADAYEHTATNWNLWETSGIGRGIPHLLEMWWPSIEISTSDNVLRSMNTRWLSVPSSSYDTTQGFQPVTTASTLGGTEMFPHRNPMLRQQRFNSYSTSLDLIWDTDYTAIYRTPHSASRLYHWEGGL